MKDAKQLLLEMNINGTVVSVIVEREHDGEVQVLVQTRWKPEQDPVYSGTLEIPRAVLSRMKMFMKRQNAR